MKVAANDVRMTGQNLPDTLHNQELRFDLDRIKTYSREEIRHMIAVLEENLSKVEQTDGPVVHHFSEGVYGRELHLPKDIFAIGKIHKHRTLNILLKGKMDVISVDGVKTITAPMIFVSEPGVKRLVYTHEDSVFVNIHGTHETNLEKIENQVIAKTYEEVVPLDHSIKVIGEGL